MKNYPIYKINLVSEKPTFFVFRSKTKLFAAVAEGVFPSKADWKTHDKKRCPFSRNRKRVLTFWFLLGQAKRNK